MKWSIHQLSKFRRDGMPVDAIVQLDDVMERNSDIRKVSPIHVTGQCTFSTSQMTCQLHLSGELVLPCARTWEDVNYPIEVDTVEIFSWVDEALRGNEEDEDIHYVDGDVIDATPVLEELVLLEVPMQVFKDNSERRERDGKGWTYKTDDQLVLQKQNDEPKVDPRLADLAKFLDQTDE